MTKHFQKIIHNILKESKSSKDSLSAIRPSISNWKDKLNTHSIEMPLHHIGVTGAFSLMDALNIEPNYTVTHLNLAANELHDIGFTILAKCLDKLQVLHTLDIRFNKIQDDGLLILSKMFSVTLYIY